MTERGQPRGDQKRQSITPRYLTRPYATSKETILTKFRTTPCVLLPCLSFVFQFARLLMVDTAIVDHLPLAYEEALHALYGDGLPRR